MNNEIPVTAIEESAAPARKNYMGFEKEVYFTVNGEKKKTYVSAQRKKDLPGCVASYQKRIDNNNLNVILRENGEIESIIYSMF